MIYKSQLIAIRDRHPDDESLIYSTFLRGLYHGDSWFSLIPKHVFMVNYHKVLEHVLSKPDIIVKVACLIEDPSAILGYSIYNSQGLIYVFCKKPWRGIGIANQLVPKDTKTVAHCTKLGLSILKKKGWDFNPFIL